MSIPWNNYCMRKFGGSIRKEIAEVGVKVCMDIKTYAEMEKILKATKDIAWVNTKPITGG